jgi:ribonuclease HII
VSDGPRLSVADIRALFIASTGRRLSGLLALYADDERAGVRDAVASAHARTAASRRERKRTDGLYALESQLRTRGCAFVAGVDEVGRGALAGPLTVAAVVLPAAPRIEGLDDSKRLSPDRREELALAIHRTAIGVSISHVSAAEIDGLGVTAALKRAVLLALAGLTCTVDHIVIDGLPLRIAENETAVVKGDSKVAAIAAASIVAKVTRDALMRSWAPDYPEYGFEVNKGYGTSEHLSAISRHGFSDVHRRSFSVGGGTGSLF